MYMQSLKFQSAASACCGYIAGIVLVVSSDCIENKRSEKPDKALDNIWFGKHFLSQWTCNL